MVVRLYCTRKALKTPNQEYKKIARRAYSRLIARKTFLLVPRRIDIFLNRIGCTTLAKQIHNNYICIHKKLTTKNSTLHVALFYQVMITKLTLTMMFIFKKVVEAKPTSIQ